LVLDGVEYFVDGETERSELLYRLVDSEQTWREDLECLSLVSRLPSVSIVGMGGGFDFAPYSLRFAKWMAKVYITSSNWM